MDKAIDFDTVHDIIDTITNLVEQNNSTSYPAIKNTIENFGIPIPFFRLPAKSLFFRVRTNENSKPYDSVSEISHIHAVNKIEAFGRANEPFQSIFYCSQDDITAYREVSDICRNGDFKNEEAFTTGVWQSTKSLLIAFLPFKLASNSEQDDIKRLNEKFDHFVQTNSSKIRLHLWNYITSLKRLSEKNPQITIKSILLQLLSLTT